MELKKKVEALLFSSGKRMHIEEIARLCVAPPDRVKNELIALAADYEAKDTSLHVQNDGEYWKLATKPDYAHVVKNIVKETELSKTLMETLATIAFKYPIKQADLIKVRTNKAYDHLAELEKMGYITRQKYGRTKLIKLTEKFFNYFNLKEENLKDKFKDFQSLADAIEGKEVEIEKIKEEQKKMAEEAKKEKEEAEVDLVDDEGHKVKLEVVDEPAESEAVSDEEGVVDNSSDKLGKLEIVDEPEEEPQEVAVPEEAPGEVGKKVDEVLGVDEGVSETEETPAESPENAGEAQTEEEARGEGDKGEIQEDEVKEESEKKEESSEEVGKKEESQKDEDEEAKKEFAEEDDHGEEEPKEGESEEAEKKSEEEEESSEEK